MADGLSLITEEARRNALAFHQESGDLAASLIVREGHNSTYPTAWTRGGGKDAPEGRWLEYGHRIVGHKPNKKDTGKSTTPRPWFRPALDAMRSAVRDRITTNVKALILDTPYTLSISADQIGRRKPRKPKQP
jgi:hypothetical protein